MRATAIDWPASDVAMVAGSVAGLAVVAALLLLDRAPAATPPTAVGTVVERSGSVRNRPAESLVWDDARRGARLGDGESLFVGPGGSASVVLEDGGRLELEENSLVVLAARRGAEEPATVTLRRGGLSASAAAPVRIHAEGGDAALRPGAQARVTGGAAGERLDVALLSGGADVSGPSAALTAFPVRLAAPAPSQRVYFAGRTAPVELRWDGAAAREDAVEVARDPGFADAIATLPGASGTAVFLPPSAGTYYWRAVDSRRAARSETRTIVVVEDLPPVPVSPADGEIVVGPPGRAVPFWWTEVDGVSTYLVEISASPAFDDVALSVTVDRPGAWIEPHLPEGTYHWRVRAADPERGRSPPSRRSSFRLVDTAVPEAPELLDPTVQVEHEGP
ncbi:MAG TPA: hypothetical protein VF841_19295 [Anaeromyxobacter sp.]